MSNFIEDNTSLTYPKFDLSPIPGGGDVTKYMRASDWNEACQALIDTKGVLRGAKWLGLTKQSSNPTPSGVTKYLWLNNSDQLVLTVDGTDTVIGAGSVSASRQIATGFGLTGGGDLSADRTLKLQSSSIGLISAKDPAYGAVGDGVTDDRAAIQAAIAAAVSLNCKLYLPAGVYNVPQAPGNFHSLILDNVSNLTICGEPGKTWLKHPNNVGGSNALCYLLRISGCLNITLDGIGINGNWGNAFVYVKIESGGTPSYINLAALPSNELPFEGDGTNFPASGSLKIVTSTGLQTLTYTGKTITGSTGKFTGVSAGSGIAQAGDTIGLIDKKQKTTSVTVASNGADISLISTINVASTTGFPTAVSQNGIVQVLTSAGWQTFQYTGKTGTSFTGVTTTGIGTLSTGNSVWYVDGAGNQAGAAMQIDPKNYGIFIYGSDGTNRTPNHNIVLRNCYFRDLYGDAFWIGAWSDNVTIENCHVDTTARNGITLSNFASNVLARRSRFINIFTGAVDSEPVDGPVDGITFEDCEFGDWFTSQSVTVSLQGGVVGRAAEWNFIRNVRLKNCRIRGGVLISDAKDVILSGNEIRCDSSSAAVAPVSLLMYCDDITIENNEIYSALTPTDLFNYGAVSCANYLMNSHAGAQPAGVVIRGNKISARNGVSGIYNLATGGYPGYSGTATSYTAPTGPNTPGEIQVSGTPWAGLTDYYLGHQVLMGGKLANIVGNDDNTLFISPLYELYSTGLAWADHRGRPTTAPTAGAFEIFATGGRVYLADNQIDCRNRDGKGAGGKGIEITTSSSWDYGYNDMRVVVENNDIRGANGHAIDVFVQDGTAPMKELQVKGNHVWDDQNTPTCTHALYLTNATDISNRVIFGNTLEGSIAPVTGLDGTWRQSDSYPGSWAGYDDPNGLIFAAPTATYHSLASKVIYVKESAEEFDTGWNALRGNLHAGIRSIGTVASGTGALDMSGKMPATVDGDVELLLISTTYSGALGADATLSTPAGFTKKASNASNYSSNTFVNRAAVWWRRKQPGQGAPVVADSGDYNEAIVIAIKDAVGYGDPFDFAPVGSQNNGLTQSVTAAGGTTATNSALFFVLLTWFSSGATNSVSGWTNADPDLTEASEELDQGVFAGGERIGLALYGGRVESAAAIGNTTATIDAENYSVWSALAFGIRPAQIPARATGLITCTTKANYVDTDYMTISDGINPAVRYEFDTAGDGASSGVAVNISGATTAVDVAGILRTAIIANQPGLEVTDNADGTLTITHRWPGVGGNNTMTENVTNAGHTVSGLSGGAG